MSARTPIAGLLAVLVCVLTLLMGPLAPARAHQAEELGIELTAITPAVITNTGDLVISGTLTNHSPDALQRIEVRLWRDATPLTTLDALADDQDALPRGAVMESPNARQQINGGGDLAPGESAEFTVRAGLGPEADEQLWLSEPDAAYRVGVEVYGWSSMAGFQRLGRASALIAYPGPEPVSYGTVVLLGHRPTLLPLAAEDTQPVFGDDSLVTQLEGRLGALLRLGAEPHVSVVIDPALYDEVTALSAPHAVIGDDGQPQPGTTASQTLATSWLADVHRLIADGRVARSLYGGLDITAAAAAERPDLIELAGAALPANHALARLPLVVVGPNGQISQAATAMLGDASPALVLASNLAGDRLVQDAGGIPLLAATPLETTPQDAVTAAGELASRQLLAARAGRPLISLVSTEEAAQLQRSDQPWATRADLDTLRAGHSADELALTHEPDAQPAPELVQATDRAIADVQAWGELVDDSTGAAHQLARMISSAWSTSFGDDLDARLRWLTLASRPTAELSSPDAIELRINDWVTTSADDNLLPVTVINNTRHAVLVRVHFESENPLRVRVEDSELVGVQPGETTTVRVRPRTLGNGKVAITAQLYTSGGHPVGAPTSFVITGTEAGRVAWLIIVASGVVLLVATALRVRQVRGETRARE